MPARRKSASELTLSGATKTNPGRYASRGETPTAEPLGYCPKSLTPAQRVIWRELVRLAPPGLLSASDRIALEIATRLVERSRTGAQRPSEVAIMVNLLARLGMTPSDRQKLSIVPPKPEMKDDPWAEFDETEVRR